MTIASARDTLMVAYASYNPQDSSTLTLLAHAVSHPHFSALMDAIAAMDSDAFDDIETFDPTMEQDHKTVLSAPPEQEDDEYESDDDDDSQQDSDDESDDDTREQAAIEHELPKPVDEEEPAAAPADEGITNNDADEEIDEKKDDDKEMASGFVKSDPRQKFAAMMVLRK